MSCKCFDNSAPDSALSFDELYVQSKCSCSARFVVIENSSKFAIEPTSLENIDKIKIDGFLVSSKTNKKCDYLFVYKECGVHKKFVFVELKGCDLATAVAQLDSTIEMFYSKHYLDQVDVRCGIVFTTYPRDNGTYRNLKRKLENKYSKKLRSIRVEQNSRNLIYNCVTDQFRDGRVKQK